MLFLFSDIKEQYRLISILILQDAFFIDDELNFVRQRRDIIKK